QSATTTSAMAHARTRARVVRRLAPRARFVTKGRDTVPQELVPTARSRAPSEEDVMRHQLIGIVALSLLSAAAASAAGVDAQALYDKKCKVCHSVKGDAGKMADKGGALDGVGGKRDAAWLKAYLQDPKSKMPDAKMPKFTYTPDELDALVA